MSVWIICWAEQTSRRGHFSLAMQTHFFSREKKRVSDPKEKRRGDFVFPPDPLETTHGGYRPPGPPWEVRVQAGGVWGGCLKKLKNPGEPLRERMFHLKNGAAASPLGIGDSKRGETPVVVQGDRGGKAKAPRQFYLEVRNRFFCCQKKWF